MFEKNIISRFPFLTTKIFLLFVLVNLSYSQNPMILNSPFIRINSNDFLPTTNDALGLMEYAYENSFREFFLYPGKNSLQKNLTGIIGYNNYSEELNYLYKGGIEFEKRDWSFKKSHFPFGLALNFYDVSLGLLYFSGPNSMSVYEAINTNYFSEYNWSIKGKNYGYLLSIGIEIFKNFNFGVSYSNQNYSADGEDGFFNYSEKIFSPKIFVLGSSYSFLDKMKIYLAYGNYDFKEEYNRNWKSEIHDIFISEALKGNFFNADLKYSFTKDLLVFFRIASDFRKNENNNVNVSQNSMNSRPQSGDATYYNFGIGVNYTLENILLVGEFNYQPGKDNLQYAYTTASWDPYITGEERKFFNWNFGLGLDIKFYDFVKLQLGIKHFKTKINLVQESDWEKIYTREPFEAYSSTFITAGTEIKLYNFIFNYIFNQSSYNRFFMPNVQPRYRVYYIELNPIRHKLMLRYEFNF